MELTRNKELIQDEAIRSKKKIDAQLANQEIDNDEYEKLIDEVMKLESKLTKENGTFFDVVIKYYKKEWKLATMFIITVFLAGVCSLMLPILTMQMIKDIMDKTSPGSINNTGNNFLTIFWGLDWWVSLLIALTIVILNMGIQFASNMIGVIMGKKIEIDLRNRALEALVRQDISYYSDKKIGEILTKIISDTQIVGDQAANAPATLLNAAFTTLVAIILMFILKAALAASLVAVFILILVAMAVMVFFAKKLMRKVRSVITRINGNVTDRINNVRLVKSSGTEDYETKRFYETHKEYFTWSRKIAKVQSAGVVILFGGISVMQFVTVAVAMALYSNDDEAGVFFATNFTSFQMLQGIMVGSLFQTVMLVMGVTQASVSSVRINQTIQAKSILDPNYKKGIIVDEIEGDIKFEDIEFAYPEKPENIILPKFSFTFEQGKSYAFVGETGSGKSTIAKLLLRFYDPSQGEIIINNNLNLKDVNLSSFLNNVGYVEQEPQILFGDVYENVRYGRFGATNEDVIEACKKAELHNLVSTWPEGYDTILGERGFMLSGGQKQRLVIARMFLKDPQLLILDEATSALDNIVEKEIQAKLEDLMKGRTTVSIAHRLSTIKNADQIIVLGANGAGIVQTGTFKELKNAPGHFKNLYNAGLMD